MMQIDRIDKYEAKVTIDIKDTFAISREQQSEFEEAYKKALGEFLDKLEEYKI